MKALIVDDSPINNLILKDILLELNIDVVSALSICNAISIFNSEHFDLVITDLTLPNESGYDLAMHVYSNSLGKVPVFSSSVDSVENRYLDIFSGSFFKPFCRQEIIELLRGSNLKSMSLSDVRASQTQLNTEKYLEALIISTNKDLEDVQSHIQQNDFNAAKKVIHKLKGAILTIDPASKALCSLEELHSLFSGSHISHTDFELIKVEKLLRKVSRTLSQKSSKH